MMSPLANRSRINSKASNGKLSSKTRKMSEIKFKQLRSPFKLFFYSTKLVNNCVTNYNVFNQLIFLNKEN